jgi:class 3 adenylate cyclase
VQAFLALVDRLNDAGPHERADVEAEIWQRFGVERALLALDMSHFSLSVRRSGILPYIALIRRMQALTRPIVERNAGVVIKYDADNMIAVFDSADAAAAAALAINRAIAEGSERFAVAMGIDFGRFLLIEGADCYGDPVNVACKLGEDVAESGEVLLTAAARTRLGPDFPHRLREQVVSVSGLEVHVFVVEQDGRIES